MRRGEKRAKEAAHAREGEEKLAEGRGAEGRNRTTVLVRVMACHGYRVLYVLLI